MGYLCAVFLGLSVLHLDPMYATDRQTDVRRASSHNASALWSGGIINVGLHVPAVCNADYNGFRL